jgi:hypothetical protein
MYALRQLTPWRIFDFRKNQKFYTVLTRKPFPVNFIASAVPKPLIGKKKTKYEFAGVGSLVQLIGFVALWVFPVGTLVGIVLFIIGSAMSRKISCVNAVTKLRGNRKSVRIAEPSSVNC